MLGKTVQEVESIEELLESFDLKGFPRMLYGRPDEETLHKNIVASLLVCYYKLAIEGGATVKEALVRAVEQYTEELKKQYVEAGGTLPEFEKEKKEVLH